jgi:hypothetical protein
LEKKKVITYSGSIVDATFVDVLRQRNKKEENGTIKEGIHFFLWENIIYSCIQNCFGFPNKDVIDSTQKNDSFVSWQSKATKSKMTKSSQET